MVSEDLPQPYYSDSHVTIYCGDCAELLPRLGRFDLLLTDPPYGIGASAGVGLYGTRKFKATDSRWDTHAWGL